MAKTKSSLKTTIAFIVVILILAAIFVVKGPLANQLEALKTQEASMQDEILSMETAIRQMKTWQDELDALHAEKGDNLVSIPSYDNFKEMLKEISTILDGGTQSYSINYGDPIVNDKVVSRQVFVSFTCYNYKAVLDRIVAFNNSNTRYRIADMSVSMPEDGSSTVSMTMYVYEYIEDAAQ